MFILKFRLKILIYFESQYVQKLSVYIVLFLLQIDVWRRRIAVATLCKDRMCWCKDGIRQCIFSSTQCNIKMPSYFFKSTQYLDEMKQWLEEMLNKGLFSKQCQRKGNQSKRKGFLALKRTRIAGLNKRNIGLLGACI